MTLDVGGQKLTFSADSPDQNGTYGIWLIAGLIDTSEFNELDFDDSTIRSYMEVVLEDPCDFTEVLAPSIPD